MMTSATTSTFDRLSKIAPMTVRPRICESSMTARKSTTSPTSTFAPGVPLKKRHV